MVRSVLTRLALAALCVPMASTALAQQSSAPAPAPETSGQHADHRDAVPTPAPQPPVRDLPPFIPPVTDEDRKAAFPDVGGHAAHDRAIYSLTQLDQLEWQAGNDAGVNVDGRGWIGGDRTRLWWRAEGRGKAGAVEDAQAHVLYARQFARWWDLVAGMRQDFRPGSAQTWAAVGIQGLAPYWFEVEVTGYVGASGRTHARVEVEYELLLTNHLILQPLVEAEVFGKADPERGIGAGLSTTDIGFRVRYEIRREIAPYLGVTWHRKWGKTASFADAAGEGTGGAAAVTGLRLWF
jgi:copper resistance protein B